MEIVSHTDYMYARLLHCVTVDDLSIGISLQTVSHTLYTRVVVACHDAYAE